MTIGIRPGQIPPFYELDEYTFQNLCRDLFDAESEVVSCDVYGVRGQSQDGIDLLAHKLARGGIEVGQCKCYKSFLDTDIRDASDEFFKHWGCRWSKENVQRFILFVACDLSNRRQQDEILEQKKRFASVEVSYEAWSAAKIQNKLRPHPSIVGTYLFPSEHWVKVICGSVYPSLTLARDTQTEQLAALLSSQTEEHLDLMRKLCPEGKRGEAMTWLNELKSDIAKPEFRTLPAE